MAKPERILLWILSSWTVVWVISALPTVREDVAEHEEKIQVDHAQGMEKENVDGQPTVKCEEIVPDVGAPGPENHAACEAHCGTLDEEYVEGRCVAGICHCRDKQRGNRKQNRHTDGRAHPTVKCEHIVPVHGEPGRRNHQACRSHCLGLGNVYDDGECTSEGVCHCRERRNFQSPTSLPSAPYTSLRTASPKILDPCENIESPEGKSQHDTHGACLAHCRVLDHNYKEGKCVGNVCHCGPTPGTLTSSSIATNTTAKHSTIRCEHLAPRDRGTHHEDCSAHCKTLGRPIQHSECLDGFCRCVPGTPSDVAHADFVVEPDRKKVETRVECETTSASEGAHEKHEMCKTHCRGLKKNYLEGHCVQGFCHCSF